MRRLCRSGCGSPAGSRHSSAACTGTSRLFAGPPSSDSTRPVRPQVQARGAWLRPCRQLPTACSKEQAGTALTCQCRAQHGPPLAAVVATWQGVCCDARVTTKTQVCLNAPCKRQCASRGKLKLHTCDLDMFPVQCLWTQIDFRNLMSSPACLKISRHCGMCVLCGVYAC